jgi:hypothetical protein
MIINKHASLYSSEACKCTNMPGCKEEQKLFIHNRIKVEWIHVVCGKDQLRALVNLVVNLWVL